MLCADSEVAHELLAPRLVTPQLEDGGRLARHCGPIERGRGVSKRGTSFAVLQLLPFVADEKAASKRSVRSTLRVHSVVELSECVANVGC